MAKFGEGDWAKIVAATHAGMSTEDFLAIAKQWLATAKHPRFQRPYTDLVYQPMPSPPTTARKCSPGPMAA